MAIARLSVGVGWKGKASPHAQYIAREGKYEKPSDSLEKLEHTEHGNMPQWAQADPNFFWKMADEHERKNGSTYREHVISLPRELSESQRLALIHDWIDQEIGDKHAYQFAIHNPPALDGQEQPHCHLMFSERTIDGIDRDPDQYFKRYNSKNPERGGAKKANTGIAPAERRAELSEQRDRWEQICNKHLELANSNARISMKSLKAQGIDRDPIDIPMIQINKPTIKQAYKEMLLAKSELSEVFANKDEITKELKQQNKQNHERIYDLLTLAEKYDRYGDLADKHYAQQAALEKQAQQAALEKQAQQAALEKQAQQAALEKQAQQAALEKQAQQAALEKQAQQAVRGRTPFDLINIRLDLSVTRPDQYTKDRDLSGDIPIGEELYRAIEYKKSGFLVEVAEGRNSHISGNETAEGIKDFMLKKLQNRAVVVDYCELSIESFTEKYSLKCDLDDLISLNERNPLAQTVEPTKQVGRYTEHDLEQKSKPGPSYDDSPNFF